MKMSSMSVLRSMAVIFTTLMFIAGSAVAGNVVDPCGLLSKADIQAVLGQTVGDGKLTGSGVASAGAPCQYTVGTGGVFSILIKTAAPGETPQKVMDEMKKRNIPVSETKGVGDRSFFSSPGYGMVQLNTFKAGKYLVVTLLVPGKSEKDQKAAASSLMTKALAKI